MPGFPIERIHHQIENELSIFCSQLNKLEVETYPTKRCLDIINHLREKVEDYRSKKRSIMDQVDDNPDEAARKLISHIHNPLVQQDVKFLDWLRGAQTQNVPWSVIPCIEHLSRKIIPEHKLLTYCAYYYNYAISWSLSERLAPYPYTVLSLPRLHRTNLLWHTLVGHEIFHPCCAEFINKHNQNALSKITQQLRESDELFRGLEEERIERISGPIHLAWRRATEELLCDMACVELFGPAGILTMRAFAACSSLDDMPSPTNNFYPPWRYRFEVVWENSIDIQKLDSIYSNCSNSEIMECFKQDMESFGKLVSSQEGAALVDRHPQAKIAYKQVKNLLPAASKFVKESLPGTLCRWHSQRVLNQIPKLLERLEKGIPPNEIILEVDETTQKQKYETQSAELPAILIAGWIYETYWQKKYTANGEIMPYETMSRLLLKACEDI